MGRPGHGPRDAGGLPRGAGLTAPRRTDPLIERLRAAGCVFAEDEASELRRAASGEALEALVRRREGGEPLEVLVGAVELCGLRLAVAPGVFVPRQRTALLARLAVAATGPGDVAAELCCGVAPVAALVASSVPGAEVHAADVDPAAVACARANLAAGEVHLGDGYDALPRRLRGRVAVLAANAPYVPDDEVARMPPEARLHEPPVALSGGPDGLDVQRRVVAGAPAWLRPGGVLLVETGRPQAGRTVGLMEAAGLATTLHTDPSIGGCVVAGRDLRRAGRG